jgi:hypothetical protein
MYVFSWALVNEGVDDVVQFLSDLGITHVVVASLYHAGYFLHPHDPRRKVHMLEDGVAYFHPTDSFYTDSPIRPKVAELCKQTDWFDRICQRVSDAGMKVGAWTVCLHNTRIGLEHPQCTIQNVYGDSYPHALSPAHPDARAFVRAVVADLADTIEAFCAAVPALKDLASYYRRAESDFLAELSEEARRHDVKLMGGLDPSIDIVGTGVYGEPLERVASITKQAKARLLPHQTLSVAVRLGFNGPNMRTPILTEEALCDVVRTIDENGADQVGFYNYAESPRRPIEWIRAALRRGGVRSER